MSVVPEKQGRGRVLILDDEEEVLFSLRRLLRREFDVFTARSAKEGYAILERTEIHVILSDQRMPGMTGTQFFAQVKEAYPHAIRLLLTGYADLDSVISAVNDGDLFRYITKPWNPEELPGIVRGAYEHHRIMARNKELVAELQRANEQLERQVQERTADLRRALEDLSRSEQTLRDITQCLAEGLVALDLEGCITLANPEAEDLLGLGEAELKGQKLLGLVHAHKNDARAGDLNLSPLTEALGRVAVLRGGDDTFNDSRGRRFPVSVSAAPLHRGQDIVGTVVAFQDVSERKRLEEELERLASQDPLTGLYNRRELERRLLSDLERMRRYRQPLSLLLMDLDRFKDLNDSYGHQVGDAVLRSLATLLKDCVRSADYVARYGGEEFVVVLPHTDGRKARHLAERIRARVASFVFVDAEAGEHQLTISVGVACFPDEAADYTTLIRRADMALYQAKEGGRNRVEGMVA